MASAGSVTTYSSAKEVLAKDPAILNVDITLVDTEYSFMIPAGCRKFMIRSRGYAKLKLSYMAGQSGSNYVTIDIGCSYSEDKLLGLTAIPVYFQGSKPNDKLEVVYWMS